MGQERQARLRRLFIVLPAVCSAENFAFYLESVPIVIFHGQPPEVISGSSRCSTR
jgi:hypothetical protein